MTLLDRLLGRPEPRTAKAVTSLGPWANAIPLSSLSSTPQRKAAAGLAAYRVGWFNKAGSKIARDVSSLDWSVSLGDAEEGDSEQTLDRPAMDIPFESLSPIDQFQRLLEIPYADGDRVLLTGRQLLHKTEIHLDFAGNGAWYLEGVTAGLPTALLPISPARLWPSRNRAGDLIGWVMDKDAPSGGVPFDVREILWFSTGGPDDDVWGTSVVEAVYSQVPLTDLMARHTANVLTTGGRLAGMMWPRERALTEDEFTDAQRAWRNVASDPDAGKRLLIFPEPMEYAAGASTPAEIGIPELATLNRDEILTAFPISPYRLGVPMPGGLNSGEVRREDRRDYWEETIYPRADLITETVQAGLLPLYERAMGATYDFSLDIPQIDDATTIKGKVEAYKGLVSIGSDPKESLTAVGLDHIKWLGLPPLLDPVQQARAAEEAREALAERPPQETQAPPPSPRPPAPPAPKSVKADRQTATAGAVDAAEVALRRFFREQEARIVANLRAMPPTKAARQKATIDDWWDDDLEDRELASVLRSIYASTGRSGLQAVADVVDRVIAKSRIGPVMAQVIAAGAARIRGINDRTKEAVQRTVAEGVRRGYSVTQLTEGVVAEGYGGVMGLTLDNGTAAFDELRAETIARTETMNAYNQAALLGYKEFGVSRVEAIDGDEDDACAARNGQVFDVDAALEESDAEHPNGTLDWIALFDDKAQHEEEDVTRAGWAP